MSKTMRNSGFCLAYADQSDDSEDIKLLPKEYSAQHKNEYQYLFNTHNIYLQEVIPVAQNFFYIVEAYDSLSFKRNLLLAERGVGELYEKEGSFYLKREFVKTFNDGSGEYPSKQRAPHNFSTFKNLIVRSYIPDHYIDLFIYPYSVLCSIEPGIPTPVELQEKTLLGRLKDSVQSIDSSELSEILEGESLQLNSIVLKPKTRPKTPKKGTVIFNRETDCFEGYDGSEWVTIE